MSKVDGLFKGDAALVAELERQVAHNLQARQAAGTVEEEAAPYFPTFGAISDYSAESPSSNHAALNYHLKQLNEMGTFDTSPVLVSSPATRTPYVGRIWARIRLQAHQLILFYLNRYVQHDIQRNIHLTSVLNELAKLNAEQAQTITALRRELDEQRQSNG